MLPHTPLGGFFFVGHGRRLFPRRIGHRDQELKFKDLNESGRLGTFIPVPMDARCSLLVAQPDSQVGFSPIAFQNDRPPV